MYKVNKIFLCLFFILGVSSLVFFVFPRESKAVCWCEGTFCQQNTSVCTDPLNAYLWSGFNVNNSGACQPSDTCLEYLAGAPNWPTTTVECQYCSYGYGDLLGGFINQCVQSCGGGGVESCGETSPYPALKCGGGCSNGKSCKKASSGGGVIDTCKCIRDSSSCTVGTWDTGVCFTPNCPTDSRYQTRSVSPVGCETDNQCVASDCRPSVCSSSTITNTNVTTCSPTNITVNGVVPPYAQPGTYIEYFFLAFYNTDNLVGGIPQPIVFGGSHYSQVYTAATTTETSHTFTINYADFDRPDENWGLNYPVNIQANGYFILSDGGLSAPEVPCVRTFTIVRPTCNVSGVSPNPLTVSAGSSVTVVPSYTTSNSCYTVDTAVFTVDSSVASVCDDTVYPSSCPAGLGSYVDTVAALQARLTAFNPGNVNLAVNGIMVDEGGIMCGNTPFGGSSSNPVGWWQGVGGDIQATSGNLISDIPAGCSLYATCDLKLVKDPPAGSSVGMPITAGAGITTGAGVISSTLRNAINSPYLGNAYTYTFFESKLPSAFTGLPLPGSVTAPADILPGSSYGTVMGNYTVFKRTGDLDINIAPSFNVASNKVILFVDGNVTIRNNINLNDGTGFFMIIASGDTNLAPTVGHTASAIPPVTPDLEGIYFAEGQVNTGSTGTGDQQVYVRGSIVGMGGVSLDRQLANNTLGPGETFDFAPDLIFLFPGFLGVKSINWTEVAP